LAQTVSIYNFFVIQPNKRTFVAVSLVVIGKGALPA